MANHDLRGRKFGFILVIMLIMLLAMSTGLMAGTYSGGSGTSSNPYQIANLDDLQELSTTSADWGAYFIQTTDIDASATSGWNEGAGFSPIGTGWDADSFTGTYNGQYHTISGLYINRTGTDNIALFGFVRSADAVIENIGVTNADISGLNNVGALGGYVFNGSTIRNCFSTGSVSGSARVGGLVGDNRIGNTITYCYSRAAVSGVSYVGGFVGHNSDNGGGANPETHDCYSTGAVTISSGSDWRVGGFVGENQNAILQKCYSTGRVISAEGEDPTNRGFAGQVLGGTISLNFWDMETSLQSTSRGGDATGKTTAEMKTQSTFTDAGWDFSTTPIWKIDGINNGGYPYLSWEYYPNALDFDGTDDYVILADEAAFDFTTAMTVEAWIKVDTFDKSYQAIVTKGDSAWRLHRRGETDHISFGTSGLANVDLEGSTNVNDGKWHHIAGVYNGMLKYLYVDGKLDASENAPGAISTNNDQVYIAENKIYTRLFNGQIDEVRIWNDARTAAELRANMYKELAGSEDNLVAYHKFNEIDLTTPGHTLDSSGNGHDGTYEGTMTDADSVTSGAFAGPRNCLDFDGVDDYVNLNSPTALDNLGHGSYTIEAWIKTSLVDTRQAIVGNYDGTPAYVLELHNTGNLRFYVNDCGYNSSANIDDDQWHHVAGVRDFGNDIRMYVDGVEVYSYGSDSEGSFTVANNTMIGRNPSSSFALNFDGLIDDVRIWNTARTPQQIRDNMCKTLVGNEDGLVAYYRFDQESTAGQTTLYDLTANGNDGTLTDMDPTTDWVASTAFTTWIGSEGTVWATAGNWSRNAAPVLMDNVGIISYTGGNSPSVGATANTDDIVIATNATLTISGSNQLNVGGNWMNNGTFAANTSTVVLNGTYQFIGGDTTFYNLTKNVLSADTLTFENGSANKTIVANTLDLQGAIGQLLSLRSDTAGSQWEIDPQGTRTLACLDVKDSKNTHATDIAAGATSTDSGNNTKWTFARSATVTTQAVSSIGATTATGNGNITDLGTPNPTAHGVCWNTTGTPTTEDSTTNEEDADATGAFTTSMTGLTANTTYYVRAYATNTAGTAYGSQVSFTTADYGDTHNLPAGVGNTLTLTPGDGSALAIENESAANGANISIGVFESTPSNPSEGIPTGSLIKRYIEVEKTGDLVDGEFLSVIKIHYTDDEIAGIENEIDLRVFYYDTTSGLWLLAVYGNTAGSHTWKGDIAAPALAAAVLGDYGVDCDNNIAWAVVDHFTDFGVGDGSPAWAFQDDDLMLQGNSTEPETSVELNTGSSCLWIAGAAATADTNFPDGNWQGQVYFNSIPTNTHQFTLSVGTWTSGGGFVAGSPAATITTDGVKQIFEFNTGADGTLTVGTGQNLAIQIGNSTGSNYTVLTGGLRSWLNSPSGSPGYPTLVELTSFTAASTNESIILNWETASEVNNTGFELWRAPSGGYFYDLITEHIIAAEGGETFGTSYSFEDTAVEYGITYYYKLEDIDSGGVSSFYGPVAATVGEETDHNSDNTKETKSASESASPDTEASATGIGEESGCFIDTAGRRCR